MPIDLWRVKPNMQKTILTNGTETTVATINNTTIGSLNVNSANLYTVHEASAQLGQPKETIKTTVNDENNNLSFSKDSNDYDCVNIEELKAVLDEQKVSYDLEKINSNNVFNSLDILKQRNAEQIVAPVNNIEYGVGGNPIKASKPTKKKKNIVRVEYISTTAVNNVNYTKEVLLLQNPMKYEGGKYHDLPQILPYFPSEIGTFVDVFGGAFTMGINVKAQSHIYNDYSKHVSSLIVALSTGTHEDNLQKVKDIIAEYKLEATSEKTMAYKDSEPYKKVKMSRFNKLKKAYNESETKCPFQFYVLSIFPIMGFVKIDNNDNFTSNVGFKASFNNDLQKKFLDYSKHLIESENIQYFNESFEFVYDLSLTKNDFVYCDVPYFNSKAGYNNGWTEQSDTAVLLMLDDVNSKGVKFAYSNVIEHKNKLNQKLIDWAEANDYIIHYLDKDYKKKLQFDDNGVEIEQNTQEVLITNYTQGVNTNIEMAKSLNEDKFIIQGKALNNDELLRANRFIELADNELVLHEKSIIKAIEHKAQEIKYRIQAGSELLLFKAKCKVNGLNFTEEVKDQIDFKIRSAQYYMRVAKDKRLAKLSVEQIMKIDKPSFEKLKQMVKLDDNLLADVLEGDAGILKPKKATAIVENTYSDVLTNDEFQKLIKLNKKDTVVFFIDKLRAVIDTKSSNNKSYTKEDVKVS